MSKRDHLSNELNLDLSLSEKGVSGKARLRSLAAFDRLLGSLIDVPASKLESISNRIRANSSQEVKLIEVETLATENLITNDERTSQLVGENSLQRQLGFAANKAHVVSRSVEYLAEIDQNVTGSDETKAEDTHLDEDWLNYFEKYAEQASSERMRDLWARVLAGEIRKPQSFSLVTLRFMSELDKDIATLFESETEYRMMEGFILKPDKAELVGERLLNLSFLDEVGLLQDVGTGFSLPMKAKDGVFRCRQGNFVLSVGTKSDMNLSLIRITRIGREIVNVLPRPNHVEVLSRIESRIHSKVTFSQIEEILEEKAGGMTLLRPVRILKTQESN